MIHLGAMKYHLEPCLLCAAETCLLPGSGTPLKRQHIDNRTISLGSPMLPPDFAGDFDMDYFTSVLIFLDHEPDANYIEQNLVQ